MPVTGKDPVGDAGLKITGQVAAPPPIGAVEVSTHETERFVQSEAKKSAWVKSSVVTTVLLNAPLVFGTTHHRPL